MSQDHREFIRRWFEEVWNKGRASAIDEMMAAGRIAMPFRMCAFKRTISPSMATRWRSATVAPELILETGWGSRQQVCRSPSAG